MEQQKKRRPNFSDEEVMAIITAVTERQDILLGKLSSEITVKVKLLQWQAVTDCVNCVSTVKRDAAEVRKKFTDLRTQVKKKAAAEKHYSGSTGGGPPVNVKYSHVEEAMLPLLSRTAVFGLGLPESEVNVSNAVGGQPEEANDTCLEIELVEGTVQDLPGAEDLSLAEDFYNTNAGPSGIDVTANRTQPRTFDHQEPGTSTPSTKPDTRRATESCETRKRKRRSSDAPNHALAQEMLSVQKEILSCTKSMAASFAVTAAAVEKIASAFVVTEPLENP